MSDDERWRPEHWRREAERIVRERLGPQLLSEEDEIVFGLSDYDNEWFAGVIAFDGRRRVAIIPQAVPIAIMQAGAPRIIAQVAAAAACAEIEDWLRRGSCRSCGASVDEEHAPNCVEVEAGASVPDPKSTLPEAVEAHGMLLEEHHDRLDKIEAALATLVARVFTISKPDGS